MRLFWTLLGSFFSLELYAGGGGGHISDLLYPAVNFFLFFGFLVWKIKKPLSEMFTEKSKEVEDFYSFADKKNKEAEMGYEEFGHVPEFTYWDGKMWTDIRMEKRLKS